jgi:hypothetical protein
LAGAAFAGGVALAEAEAAGLLGGWHPDTPMHARAIDPAAANHPTRPTSPAALARAGADGHVPQRRFIIDSLRSDAVWSFWVFRDARGSFGWPGLLVNPGGGAARGRRPE